MRNPIIDTEQFYAKHFPDVPPLTSQRLLWRIGFLKEEMRELSDSVFGPHYDRGLQSLVQINPEGIVDGLIDLIVVALGTLYEAGVDVNLAWTVVHEANMQKARGNMHHRPGSYGYDLIKPEGWSPPDHSDNLGVLKELAS